MLTQGPLTFRLGETQPAGPRSDPGQAPAGSFCFDTNVTPLLEPDIAESGMTPEELAASEPPGGSRWSVEGTLVLSAGGEARLCTSYVDDTCEGGAPVTGPVLDEGAPLVLEGTWFVFVQDGVLVDPIRAAG